MPRTGTITVAALGGLLLAALLWAMLAPPPPSGSAPTTKGPVVSLSRTALTRYDDRGRPLWELEVKMLRLTQEGTAKGEGEGEGEGVTLRLFAPEAEGGGPVLIVKAGKVELSSRSGDLALAGGLEARAVEAGLEFTAEEARWDAEEGVLYSAGPVSARSPQGRLSGTGFRYSLRTGKLTIEHRARLVLNLKPRAVGGEGGRER